MARRTTIALVDDEPDLSGALGEYLSDLGYDVLTADCVAAGKRLFERGTIDLIVLDLNMPGGNGLDWLRELRAEAVTPVLILTSNPDPIERVVGLELGADDFVVKPVDPRELAARVAGILGRHSGRHREVVAFERVSVDLAAARLLVVGRPCERLGPGEVMLVRAFHANPNRLLTRDELLDLAPADSRHANDRSIDTRIARLRRKLDTEAIRTMRGHGYMFVPPPPRPGDMRELAETVGTG